MIRSKECEREHLNNITVDKMSLPLGEVVRSATTDFVAVSHQLYGSPPIGSLVKCGGTTVVYGVVGEVVTQSLDPGRRPTAMGTEEETVESVYRNNPQLERLYATEFQSISVGYFVDGVVNRHIAPLPPKIHDHVYLCEADEVEDFSQSLEFLRSILSAPFGSPDDVLSSFLRTTSQIRIDGESFLVDAGKFLAVLLNGQPQRLSAILKRLSL